MTAHPLPADLEARVTAGGIKVCWNEMSRTWLWWEAVEAPPTLQEMREAVEEAKEGS